MPHVSDFKREARQLSLLHTGSLIDFSKKELVFPFPYLFIGKTADFLQGEWILLQTCFGRVPGKRLAWCKCTVYLLFYVVLRSFGSLSSFYLLSVIINFLMTKIKDCSRKSCSLYFMMNCLF